MRTATLDESEFLHVLHEIEVNSPSKRRDAATRLMRLVAVHLQGDEPLPRGVRDWLSCALAQATRSNADTAFGLKRPRGGQKKFDREATERAYVYALVSWGWTQERAAERVAEFMSVEGDSVRVKKRSNSAKSRWSAEGPFLSVRAEDELPEATEAHLRAGRRVVVELCAPGKLRTRHLWLDPRILASN